MSLEFPQWSRVSCSFCKKWLLDGKANVVTRKSADGRIDLPQLRPLGAPTPCHKCPKIPEGVDKIPENAIELSDKNAEAYSHYLRCRAVGVFPDDQLVKLHAVVIRSVFDQFEQIERVSVLTAMKGMLNVRAS